MEQDENTLDTQEEQKESETTVEEETADAQEDEETQTQETKAEDKVTLSPAEYRHFKKWDANGRPSVKDKVVTPPQKVSPQPSVEETVLLANGMDEGLLGELKAVAKARGITSLIKAQNDPIFVAVKEKFEKDQKQKDASLGASRGSGSVKPKKDFGTPNLSRDDHRKMVADALG